ncbi:hypothetical protein, partial [Mesorhizobium sp. LNJC391B00]|uniref:hypothetical protein n=1 Tax=Mesorhizobium sp. LNJC391B00 TaxID=1287273 RepID=UPI0012ECA69D
ENWMEANRYINMDDLREHKKLALRQPHDQHHGRPILQNLTHTTLQTTVVRLPRPWAPMPCGEVHTV